jgi:hypothetical protein
VRRKARISKQHIRLEQLPIRGEERLQLDPFGSAHRLPAPQQQPPFAAAVLAHHRACPEEFLAPHLVECRARVLEDVKLVEHDLPQLTAWRAAA